MLIIKKLISSGRITKFEEDSIKVKKFKELANQMLIVPFVIEDRVHNKTYEMKYQVGFIGCDQNEKNEVTPVQRWLVSPMTKEDQKSILKSI